MYDVTYYYDLWRNVRNEWWNPCTDSWRASEASETSIRVVSRRGSGYARLVLGMAWPQFILKQALLYT